LHLALQLRPFALNDVFVHRALLNGEDASACDARAEWKQPCCLDITITLSAVDC